MSQPITGYLGKPESLPAALAGVDRMYLAPLPETLDVTLEMAKAANVSYVVALSGGAHWQRHADTIAASGLTNTQLGPGEFLENFAIWSSQIKATRTVREPYPSAVEAPIAMDDIARVAAALLVKPEQSHHGQMYRTHRPGIVAARRDRRADRSRDRRGCHLRAVQPRRGRSGTASDHGFRMPPGIST